MLKYLKSLIGFVKAVAEDKRIPDRDRTILLVLVALIISPFDIIPDWIPIIGVMDDVVITAIVLDYFFNHLDREILLSHYPWDLRSFLRLKKVAGFLTWMAPQWVKDKVWKYKPSVYK